MSREKKLTRLELEQELQFWNASDDAKNAIFRVFDYGVTDLNLEAYNIASIPAVLGRFNSLTSLHLGFGSVTEIPTEIFNLHNLRHLSLPKNKISVIPCEIRGLRKLEVLCLRDNEILEVPSDISKLKRLIELDLLGNNISSVPDEMHYMPNLQSVLLQDNAFEQMPDRIGRLRMFKGYECNGYEEYVSSNAIFRDQLLHLGKRHSGLQEFIMHMNNMDDDMLSRFVSNLGKEMLFKVIGNSHKFLLEPVVDDMLLKVKEDLAAITIQSAVRASQDRDGDDLSPVIGLTELGRTGMYDVCNLMHRSSSNTDFIKVGR